MNAPIIDEALAVITTGRLQASAPVEPDGAAWWRAQQDAAITAEMQTARHWSLPPA